ncbi:MAG: sensor histidine kinase [Lachnospiraceae bacterium]
MKLKTRLKLSFCIMIILPILVVGLLITAMFHMQAVNIKETYGVDSVVEVDDVYTPVNMIYKITKGVYDKVLNHAEKNADSYNDPEYVRQVADDISQKLVDVVLVRDGAIFYSNSNIDDETLRNVVFKRDYQDGESNFGAYFGGEIQCVIQKLQFTDSVGHNFDMYLVTSLNQVIPQIKRLLVESIFSIILVLVITATVLTVWVYRSMVRPLSRLKLATDNIKEGNLDFEMNVSGNDEIAVVCHNFEEMRLILKDTANQRLRDEQEERELIRNISHDLKTPLTSIKGYIEGLLDGVANTPEKQEKYLRTISNKVNDMDKLINELTVYSRIDSNRQPYVFKKIDMHAYWDDCYDEISTELEAKGINLVYNNELAGKVYVMADAEQIKRVINNIISNSVKYINNDHGTITIDIKRNNWSVLMSITDNGKGIGKEDLGRVFERFYRADSSRNSSQGGSGLGLAIAKKIIEEHNGTIQADSVENEYTRITIELPVYKEEHIDE